MCRKAPRVRISHPPPEESIVGMRKAYPNEVSLASIVSISKRQQNTGMRLPIICKECAIAENGISPSNIASVEFRDDGRYETTCPKGHVSITILQAQRFELLFEIGAYAISDGHYREAILSFTSSLERFYEFFIRAAFLEKGLDEKVIDDDWKLVERQSERQLGAFIFLYTSEFQRKPALLESKKIGSRKAVDFRNDVVHKGKILSREEALEYGQIILDLIRPSLQEVKTKYPNGVQKTVFQHLKKCHKNKGQRVGTMSTPTIISLSSTDDKWENRSLQQALKEQRRWK